MRCIDVLRVIFFSPYEYSNCTFCIQDCRRIQHSTLGQSWARLWEHGSLQRGVQERGQGPAQHWLHPRWRDGVAAVPCQQLRLVPISYSLPSTFLQTRRTRTRRTTTAKREPRKERGPRLFREAALLQPPPSNPPPPSRWAPPRAQPRAPPRPSCQPPAQTTPKPGAR